MDAVWQACEPNEPGARGAGPLLDTGADFGVGPGWRPLDRGDGSG
jgi:hypothetical protein